MRWTGGLARRRPSRRWPARNWPAGWAGRSQYHVDLGRLLQRLAPSMHCVLSRRQILLVDRQLVAIGQDGLHHLHPAICKTISTGQSQSQTAISLPIPPYQAPATTCTRRQRIAASGGPLAITQPGGRNAVTLGILLARKTGSSAPGSRGRCRIKPACPVVAQLDPLSSLFIAQRPCPTLLPKASSLNTQRLVFALPEHKNSSAFPPASAKRSHKDHPPFASCSIIDTTLILVLAVNLLKPS